ncbi:MAG: hypothetical protein DRI54_07010 [Bacteroidetes bacterium]|nr:MAG: hypothetical protein DRI54_07010 [Bacteroidota bacterium]
MKRAILLLLMLFIGLSVFSQSENADTLKQEVDSLSLNTRSKTIAEAFTINSVVDSSLHADSSHFANSFHFADSSLFSVFESVGIEPVKEAYKLNSLIVDSLLVADSLETTFLRVYGSQAIHLFILANKSPEMAMAIFLPWFMVIFLIVTLVLFVVTVFDKPGLLDVAKPANDPNIFTKPISDDKQLTEEIPDDEDDHGGPPENPGGESGQNN